MTPDTNEPQNGTLQKAILQGTELEEALAADNQKVVESMVERTLTEALKVNPRTEYVTDFSFTWNADEMHCTFLVKGVEWDKLFRISI